MSSPLSSSGRSRVLVIDDEVGPRESIRILLKQDYDILCADRVESGLGILRQEHPDIVIMDIRMPGKSGLEGLEDIRRIDTSLPVIMLTGYGDLSTAQQALRHGASDYLTKPFDVAEMMEAVRRNLDSGSLSRRRSEAVSELRRLNEELLSSLAESENLAEVGKRSAEFAHDMRNPLQLVSGYVDLLQESIASLKDQVLTDEKKNGEMDEYFNVIQGAVARCREMSEGWRRGQGDIGMSSVDLLALVNELSAISRPLMESGRVTMKVDVQGEGPWTIEGNQSQLRRVLQNLFNNAIDAMERSPDRTLRVSFSREPDTVVLEVSDTGCGMDEEVQAHVFDRYFTTKSADQGTGLGLTIAQEFVVGHNGELRIQSQPQRGTRVQIRFPAQTGS